MIEHDPQHPENSDNFDRLLANRQQIAEFVNSFTSERVQRKAFEAIVCSLGLANEDSPETAPVERLHVVPPPANEPLPTEDAAAGEAESASPSRRRRTKTGAKKTYTIPKGLNWAPDGAPSLETFIEEKQPRNNDEKNLLSCFYLSHMMGLSVDTEHVLAVYQAAKWDAPAHPHTSLQATASKHAWIDTADMKDIKVVWQGENYVNSKMPVEPKTKTG